MYKKLKPLWRELDCTTEKEWKATLNLVDRILGAESRNEGKKKSEFLFLKSMWRLWGWKHSEQKETVEDLTDKLKRALVLYKEILNADIIK